MTQRSKRRKIDKRAKMTEADFDPLKTGNVSVTS